MGNLFKERREQIEKNPLTKVKLELIDMAIKKSGVDEFLDKLFEHDTELLSTEDDGCIAFAILENMREMKEFVLVNYELSIETKIKWNARYNFVREELETRMFNDFKKQIEEDIKENTKSIRYEFGKEEEDA